MRKCFYVFAFIASTFAPSATFSQETYQVPEAYEIYSQVLPTRWPVTVAHARKLIIRAETANKFELCLKPEGESVALLQPVIANFLEVNKKRWLLEKTFTMDQSVEFVFSRELEAIFSDGVGGWEAFYKKFPDSGGFNEVSAVGFNADKTVAIVYVAHHCGGLCGGGQFYVLKKAQGRWHEFEWKGQTCTWVSKSRCYHNSVIRCTDLLEI